ASYYGKSLSSVYEWIRRKKAGESLADKPAPGRPLKLSPTQFKQVYKKMHGKRGRSTRWAAQTALKSKVSQPTVWRYLRRAGKVPHREARRTKLYPNDAPRRLAYALKY